jgi:hypothetical protein
VICGLGTVWISTSTAKWFSASHLILNSGRYIHLSLLDPCFGVRWCQKCGEHTIRYVLSSIAQFIVLNLSMSPVTYLHWKGGVCSGQHCTKSSLYVVKNSEAAATPRKLVEGEAK